jgi:hypothetical protein
MCAAWTTVVFAGLAGDCAVSGEAAKTARAIGASILNTETTSGTAGDAVIGIPGVYSKRKVLLQMEKATRERMAFS